MRILQHFWNLFVASKSAHSKPSTFHSSVDELRTLGTHDEIRALDTPKPLFYIVESLPSARI